MSLTVNAAFNSFNANSVNLDPNRTIKARSSRDWLIQQINNLPTSEATFPLLYQERHTKFGSFSRNTKIRELDDVDLIMCLHADSAFYEHETIANRFRINTTHAGSRLQGLSDNGYLNSIKVVNCFVKHLSVIETYKKAEIHRQQEAVTLKLSSYEWNFDIVPSFYTRTNFYIIPDGLGGWKSTNPDIDQARVARLNTLHNGRVNQLIRTLKFWNRRTSVKEVPSYLFENMILGYIESTPSIGQYIDVEMLRFWNFLQTGIFNNVNDPKGFQGNLNNLTYDDKTKIASKSKDAHSKALEANRAEVSEKDERKAINKWREIFGDQFPKYE